MSILQQLLKESFDANIVAKYNLTQVSNCVGFCEKDQKWYGWSHRAVVGFKLGDKVFETGFGDDSTPYNKHGKKTIKTLADAKLSAQRVAKHLS